ncbi:uncharacterized protein [Watersipora subatra]|uniref:uncharacterized protein n=1 Tax=Watersipora subatra TaxID=2589382 RepID=UPI00355BE00A
MATKHGFTYIDYRTNKANTDYNQNDSTTANSVFKLRGGNKSQGYPTQLSPCLKNPQQSLNSPEPPTAEILSPPEMFRDPPKMVEKIPAPPEFVEAPAQQPLPAVRSGSLKSVPVPKPRHISVSKTCSIESTASNSSSLTSSGDSNPSSPRSRRSTSQIRKQRASINKDSARRFVERHSESGLTSSLPMPDETVSKSPYTDDWIKKKQYLSFQKQHVCRDVKFDAECNILLTTKFSVQMYDNNGVFKEKLYLNRVSEPWGLHINHQTGNVLVTDHEDGCVKEFNALGIVVQEYGPIPTPCGVTVSKSGYVFACSQSQGCVYVFDKRGEVVTRLGKGVLTSPTYIVLHGKSVLVSDDSRIVAFNIENEIEFVYGQRDGSDHPGCLCVDVQTGYVFSTSYYKDQLVALNKSMRRAIRIKDIKRPLTCTISPFGHLLIGEHNSKGMLFRMFRM